MPEKTIFEFYYEFGSRELLGWTLKVTRTTPKMLYGTMHDSADENVGNFSCKKEDLGVVKMLSFSGEKYLSVRLEGKSYKDARSKAATAIRDRLYSMANAVFEHNHIPETAEAQEDNRNG